MYCIRAFYSLQSSHKKTYVYAANADLRKASKSGDKAGIRSALERGAEIESRLVDKSPLELASSNGHLEAVKLLLWEEAKVDSANRHNRTPLWFAAHEGHAEVADVLLQHGADINTRSSIDFKTTPLMEAVVFDHLGTVLVLMDGGADDKVENAEGKTALEWAVQLGGRQKIVELLRNWDNI